MPIYERITDFQQCSMPSSCHLLNNLSEYHPEADQIDIKIVYGWTGISGQKKFAKICNITLCSSKSSCLFQGQD
jgi:hypothetical protein